MNKLKRGPSSPTKRKPVYHDHATVNSLHIAPLQRATLLHIHHASDIDERLSKWYTDYHRRMSKVANPSVRIRTPMVADLLRDTDSRTTLRIHATTLTRTLIFDLYNRQTIEILRLR